MKLTDNIYLTEQGLNALLFVGLTLFALVIVGIVVGRSKP